MKIPTVKVEFHDLPDFILEEKEYKKFGGIMKFCSANSIQLKDIKKVHHLLMRSQDYPIREWEG